MAFDISAYKKQCYAIATAYSDFLSTRISVERYEEIVAANSMVPAAAVDKITVVVLQKGSQFRPLDAVQF